MDDDIDIEEHDVLDNPKIKSIFPDLSRVKIEIPDDDVEMCNEADKQPQLFYQNFNITGGSPMFTDEDSDKPFENNSDGVNQNGEYFEVSELYCDNSEVSGQVTFNIANDHCYAANENNDNNVLSNSNFDQTAFVPNKIVLGSKYNDNSSDPVESPGEMVLRNSYNAFKNSVSNYDLLYQEALSSNTSVVLEDWGVILNVNRSFCKECNILFPTVNALDAHKMVSHSFLVALDVQYNTARKSTAAKNSEKLCNHCKLYFPDDTALIKHLYELLPMSKFDDSQTQKQEPVEAVSETCTSKNSYKCLLCKAVFQTKYAAKKHRLLKHPKASKSKIFVLVKSRKSDVDQDEPIKKVEKPSLKPIPKENDDLPQVLVSDTLFKCPTCKTHFTLASAATVHLRSCEGRHNFAYSCTVCKNRVHIKDKPKHTLQHKLFRKIRFLTVKNLFHERILCKCPKCSVCCSEATILMHVNSCNSVSISESSFKKCTVCDSYIEASKFQFHKRRHKTGTKDDFIVLEFSGSESKPKEVEIEVEDTVDETDTKKIKYWYCKFCHCCVKKSYLKGHGSNCILPKAKMSRKQCEKCGLVFTRKAYFPHASLHIEWKATLNDFIFVDLLKDKPIKPPITDMYKCQTCEIIFFNRNTLSCHICNKEKFKTCYVCNKKYSIAAYDVHMQYHGKSEQSLMPALLQKYDSINETWNIVYMCSSCSIVSMSYDFAIEHSQRHINNISNDDFVHCSNCSLNIGTAYYTSHMALHESYPCRTNLFNIFTYDYKQLFRDEWMNLFQTLPKQDVDIILSKSIYRKIRHVKLNQVNTDSVKDKTCKYYCARCKVYVEEIETHIKSRCLDAPRHKCDYCRVTTKSFARKLAHELTHGVNNNKFAIVSFNEDDNQRFNYQLQRFALDSERSVKRHKTIKRSDEENNENERQFKLYRCNKCLIVENPSTRHEHKCSFHERKFCETCSEYYATDRYEKHLKTHKKLPDFCKANLNVITFGEKGEYVLYRCKSCNLCLHNPSWTERHVCLPNSKYTYCKKCMVNFSKNTIKTHRYLHQMNPNLSHKSIAIENFDPKNVFGYESGYNLTKCNYCQVSCTKRGMAYHSCTTDKRYCVKCKLQFSVSFYRRHECARVSNAKTTRINYYKCVECKKGFRKKDSVKEHKCTSLLTQECNTCGLFFSRKMYSNHLALHKRYANLPQHLNIIIVNKSGSRLLPSVDTQVDRSNKVDADKKVKTESDEQVEYKKPIQKKYKFFQCSKCRTTFSSITSLMASRHVCKKTRTKSYCKKCDICIPAATLLYHKELHKKNPRLSKKTIQIIKFPRKIKMSLETKSKDSKVYYMYKCRDCGVCLGHRYSAKNHSCNNDTMFCPTCFVSISRFAGSQRHSLRHTNCPDMNMTNIRICYFDGSGVSAEEEPVDVKSEYLNAVKKCAECSAYTLGHLHHCDSDTTKVCPKCDENFSADSLPDHLKIHDMHPELFTEHSQLSNVKEKTSKVVVYSCSCKLHFTSLTSIQKHMDVCGTTEVSTEKCSKCFLLFPTDILVTHLINHHSATAAKVSVKRVHRMRFFGCMKCETRYRRKEDLDEHLENYCNKENCVKCESCNIYYEKIYVSKHKCINTTTDVYINDVFQDLVKNLTVFKCHSCDVHFCTLTGYQFHVCSDKEDVRTCDKCQLSFSSGSYKQHHQVHNSDEYRIKVVQPQSKEVSIKCGKNKVDTGQESVASHSNSVTNATNLESYKQNCGIISSKYSIIDNRLYKCEKCSLCYIRREAVQLHIRRNPKHESAKVFNCKFCKQDFSASVYFRHKILHHDTMNLRRSKDFVIEIVGANDDTVENCGSNEHKLYQCHDCKIAFTTLDKCVRHLENHKVPHAKLRVACKLCGCKFLGNDLNKHKEVNHDDAYVDELVVEEYKLMSRDLIRMNVFNVANRIQSEMVSTTTGVDGDLLELQEESEI